MQCRILRTTATTSRGQWVTRGCAKDIARVGTSAPSYLAILCELELAGVDIQATSRVRGDAPFDAIRNGKEANVKLLLDMGVDINTTSNDPALGWTVLDEAVFEGYDKILHLLLEHGQMSKRVIHTVPRRFMLLPFMGCVA